MTWPGYSVPVEKRDWKAKRNGLALVALAGPASNIVFSVVLAVAAAAHARPLPVAAEIILSLTLLRF